MKLRNREVVYQHRVISKRRRRKRVNLPLELQREVFKYVDMHVFCKDDAGLRKYMIDNQLLSKRSLRFALLWSTSKKIKSTTAHLIENGVKPTAEAMILYAQYKESQLDLSHVATEDREQAVERALRVGDIDAVRRLYQPGMNVTYLLDRRNVSCSWVFRLCEKTDLQDVTFLVEKNLIHVPTVVYLALTSGNLELLQYLYEKGGRSRYDYINMSIRAAQTGNIAILQLYLTEEDVQLELDKLHDVYEGDAVDFACKKEGILQIIKWVYSNFAETLTESMTERLLNEASCKGHIEAVQYLLQNHVRKLTEDSACLVNAVLQGHLDIYDLLSKYL